MLTGLKILKRAKATVKEQLWEQQMFQKIDEITGKQLRRSLFLQKLQTYSKSFTGDCFSNLFELSMTFGPVKKI